MWLSLWQNPVLLCPKSTLPSRSWKAQYKFLGHLHDGLQLMCRTRCEFHAAAPVPREAPSETG